MGTRSVMQELKRKRRRKEKKEDKRGWKGERERERELSRVLRDGRSTTGLVRAGLAAGTRYILRRIYRERQACLITNLLTPSSNAAEQLAGSLWDQ